MITIVTGIPGSGKSYYAVHMISKLKNKTKLIHNIDGLKLGKTLDEFSLSYNCQPLDLFTKSFHENDNSFRGYLFVVDECQTLFPKNLRNEDVQNFFQLHRHYGIDIVLLSQDYKLISPSIALLSEMQFRAVSDTANPLPGTFMYRKMIGYESIGRAFLRKKKAIFALYKTADFDQDDVRKKSRPMLYLAILSVLLISFALYKIFGFSGGLHSSDNKSQTVTKKKGPLSLEKLSSLKRFSSQSVDDDNYPESFQTLFHGRLLPVSHITDWRGTFITFLGLFFKIEDFPYPLRMTTLGFVAVVPPDVFNYALEYRASIPEPSDSNELNNSPLQPQVPAREAGSQGFVKGE